MSNLLELQNQVKILERKIELLSASPILKDYLENAVEMRSNITVKIAYNEAIISDVNILKGIDSYKYATDYRHCIKEMAEATWLNKEALGEPQYYNVYKLAYKDIFIAKNEDRLRERNIELWKDLMKSTLSFTDIATYLVNNNVELPE